MRLSKEHSGDRALLGHIHQAILTGRSGAVVTLKRTDGGKLGCYHLRKKKAERDFEVFACRPLKGPVHVPWPAKGRVSYLSKA